MHKAYLFTILTMLLSACVDSSRNDSTKAPSNYESLTEVKVAECQAGKSKAGVCNKTENKTSCDNNTNDFLSLLISFSIGALSASAITAIIFRKRLSKL